MSQDLGDVEEGALPLSFIGVADLGGHKSEDISDCFVTPRADSI